MNDYTNVKEVMTPAESFESAHVVDDYPYGRLKTKMVFYVEYKKGKGFRPVTRSLNPKTGAWNKPHAGTYAESVAIYKDEKNHFQFAKFHGSDWNEESDNFYNTFESGLSSIGKKSVKFWCFVKEYTTGRSSLSLTPQERAEIYKKSLHAVADFFKES